MAVLTVQEIDRTTGLQWTEAAAASGGDDFPNDGRTLLLVNNAGAGSITVTVNVAQKVDGQDPVDKTYTVTNATKKMIGPFPTGIYNDANGRVNVTYSGVTSVTVAAIRLNA